MNRPMSFFGACATVGQDGAMQPPLRVHQREALEAWAAAVASGARRGWVVMPPGSGKTRVGAEAWRASGLPGVVFSPNSAIQGQWEREAPGLRSLTYQALATFEPEEEGDGTVLSRLHANGRALVAELAGVGELFVILDECHHLLHVWGRLLSEVLDLLPGATVLGLTATPVAAMTAEERELEGELFGQVTYHASTPGVVRSGDLAPFAELAWLTTPTAREQEWLDEQGIRVKELVTHLSDPRLGSRSFIETVGEIGGSWAELETTDPTLADALVRLGVAGSISMPEGATVRERHRRPADVADWMAALNHWLLALSRTGEPADRDLVRSVGEVVGAVGYRWTRRGLVRTPSTVDRVLSRSANKADAAVQILHHESEHLGADLRALVVCDFERASTLPAALFDVVAPESGSASKVLAELLASVQTSALSPLLMTAKRVAGAAVDLERLRSCLPERQAARLSIVTDDDGMSSLTGWGVREWVPAVTDFFERGGCQVLVGTRGLLGEGWDGRCVTTLVDVTAAATSTAVVQIRGRALRRDPERPDKVAVTWSVACLGDDFIGTADWDRLVRKHRGYLSVDERGDIVDGVAHCDSRLSEFRVPEFSEVAAINRRAVERAADRPAIAEAWRVGEPFSDVLVSSLRVGTDLMPVGTGPAEARGKPTGWRWWREIALPWLAVVVGVVAVLDGAWWAGLFALVFLVASLVPAARRAWAMVQWRRRPPAVADVARAVAEALHATGQVPTAEVAVHAEEDDEVWCELVSDDVAASALFARSLEEALGPVVVPRYLVSLPSFDLPVPVAFLRALEGLEPGRGVAWHPVPTALGASRAAADAYGAAWQRWVGGGAARFARGPEGVKLLDVSRGADPWRATTAVRARWR